MRYIVSEKNVDIILNEKSLYDNFRPMTKDYLMRQFTFIGKTEKSFNLVLNIFVQNFGYNIAEHKPHNFIIYNVYNPKALFSIEEIMNKNYVDDNFITFLIFNLDIFKQE